MLNANFSNFTSGKTIEEISDLKESSEFDKYLVTEEALSTGEYSLI